MKISPQPITPSPSALPVKPETLSNASQRANPANDVETLQTPNLESIRAALQAEPEVRPDQVARAMIWISDPNYPPLDALSGIAGDLVADALRYPR